MPPPQHLSREEGITLCSVLLVVGFVLLVAGLSLHPHRPFITASSISSYQAGSSGSARNPRRHFGFSYEVATTRASFLFYDATVASGPALAVHGDQPNLNTTSIAGVIDVVVEPSFSAALRAGRLPVRLQLTTDISFGFNGFQTSRRFCIPNFFQSMHLDGVEPRHFAFFAGLEVTIEKKGTVSFREDGSISEDDVEKLGMIQDKSKMWQLLNNSLLKSVPVNGSYHGGTMTVADSGGAAIAQILKKSTVADSGGGGAVAQIRKRTVVSGELVGEHTYTRRVNPAGVDMRVRVRAYLDPQPDA